MADDLRSVLSEVVERRMNDQPLTPALVAAVDAGLLDGPVNLALAPEEEDLGDGHLSVRLDLQTRHDSDGDAWAVAYVGEVPDDVLAHYELRGATGWNDFLSWTEGEVGLLIADADFVLGSADIRRYSLGLVADPQWGELGFSDRVEIAPAAMSATEAAMFRVALQLVPDVRAAYAIAVTEQGGHPAHCVMLDIALQEREHEPIEMFGAALARACEHAGVAVPLDYPALFTAIGPVLDQVHAHIPAIKSRVRDAGRGF